MAADAWSSVPWKVETEGGFSIWHKSKIPYIANANALQSLDVWIPATDKTVPESSDLPASKGLWVIYIHGGAWRDPLGMLSVLIWQISKARRLDICSNSHPASIFLVLARFRT